jgi:creatinine amidohydrolase
MTVLKEASLKRPPELKLLVVPPVRFALGPQPNCAFPIDPDVACNLLEEVAGWVADSGFTRILFFNASPWSEEITKAVGRDLRIARKLRIFCTQLSALGLDFHPVRGAQQRSKLKAVLATLTEDPGSPAAARGRTVLAEISAHLAALLMEMRDLAPLANEGVLALKTWP